MEGSVFSPFGDADPSTPLRSAQDDMVAGTWFKYREKAFAPDGAFFL